MLEHLLQRFVARPEHAPRSTSGEGLRIRWLGTAGHVVEGKDVTLLFDPFLSRPSIVRTVATRLSSAAERYGAYVPDKVDAILVGHSHYDHLMDAPALARRTGALLFGSRSTCNFARAEGVPEAQLREVPPAGGTFEVRGAKVTFVPSLHGKIALGRVPFAGEVASPPRVPARVHHYRMGGAFGLLAEVDGVRVYHNGSADLVDAEVAGHRADVVLVGLAGRRATPSYLERLTKHLSPELLVPTHHDTFFWPLDRGVRLLPGVDLPGFFADAARVAPRARIVTPDYDDVLVVPPGAARDAVLRFA